MVFHINRVLTAFILQALVLWKPGDTLCNGVSQCTCQENQNGFGVMMLCRRQNFNKVPSFIIADHLSSFVFYELNLEGNAIDNIEDGAFSGTKFKRIVLSGNHIKSISDNAFDGLEPYLEELLLTFDSAMEIPIVSFERLTNLRHLEITGYGKPQLPDDALARLVNLRELTLSHGDLQVLLQKDLQHQSNLVQLNLEKNKFSAVPEIFRTRVGNLSILNLNINEIHEIHTGDFAGLETLKILDLSQNSISLIEAEGFSGLEHTLEYLSCRSCHFADEHLESVKSLLSLKELNISGNEITEINSFWRDMKSKNLQRLDVQANRIQVLSGSMLNSMLNSLRVLDLSDNPITHIDPDAFKTFVQLQEFQLNNIHGLNFDENTFVTQRETLKKLSMSGSRFLSPPLSSVKHLTALEVLALSNCGINSIPELAFEFTGRLAVLDLSNNKITSLTQRSLTGLQNSLVQIVLSENSIETLDDCVFFEFKRINFNRFGLNNNPFRCDCSMKWLYDKLKLNKSAVIVKCADGENFFDFSAMFDNCTAVDSHCESLMPSPVTPPPLQIIIQHLQKTSMTISWTTNTELEITEFAVSHQAVENPGDTLTFSVNLNERQYVITDLQPSTTYMVCVLMKTAPTGDVIQSCTHATTTNGVLSTEAIVGIFVGAFVVLLLILFIALLFVRASRQRSTHEIVLPQKGGNSKRFVKHPEKETFAPGGNKTNATLVQKLVEMSDEERLRLVNILAKRGSGAADDREVGMDVRRERYVGQGTYSMQMSVSERHFYEEIPDESLDTTTMRVETSFIVCETPGGDKTKKGVPTPPPRPAGKNDKLNIEEKSRAEGSNLPENTTEDGI